MRAIAHTQKTMSQTEANLAPLTPKLGAVVGSGIRDENDSNRSRMISSQRLIVFTPCRLPAPWRLTTDDAQMTKVTRNLSRSDLGAHRSHDVHRRDTLRCLHRSLTHRREYESLTKPQRSAVTIPESRHLTSDTILTLPGGRKCLVFRRPIPRKWVMCQKYIKRLLCWLQRSVSTIRINISDLNHQIVHSSTRRLSR